MGLHLCRCYDGSVKVKAKTKTTAFTKAMEIGFKDYCEFCSIFDGKPWLEVAHMVKDHNLSYGALKPSDNIGMVDINYKHIIATAYKCCDVIRINVHYEVYDDEGQIVYK